MPGSVFAGSIIDFEDLPLPVESFDNGSDGAGGFESRGAFFNNTFTDFGGGFTAWSGWAYSNMTDTTTPGFENQYSAITGRGADGSTNFGVAFAFTPGDAYIDLPSGTRPTSIRITNATYPFLSMRDGDAFVEPFGGTDGTEPDFFLLSITGEDEAGGAVGTVEVALADFRFSDASQDYILDTWALVDLSSLAGASRLSFGLTSSDVGQFGMNTPAYFGVDDLRVVPEPATIFLMGVGLMAACRRRRRCTRPLASVGFLVVSIGFVNVVTAGTPFGTTVVSYDPAPGQFVQDPFFSAPSAALGSPEAGGSASPSETSLVTLGGFGGSITLAFDHTVLDEPLNPHGMDAIVFGNAFWVGGDPQRHWAECATIEISLDEDANGLADDAWYLVPGSHIGSPLDQFEAATWDDDIEDETYPPTLESWIPPGQVGTWTTESYALPTEVFGSPIVANPSSAEGVEGIFGYADYAPTLRLGDLDGDNVIDAPDMQPDLFYTVPDDPLIVGITPGSGGGDAFDIAWAIEPESGAPASLPGFDFIRITSAVHMASGAFGERSAEIDAVADVEPDPFGDVDHDADIDLYDAATLQHCMLADADWACMALDWDGDDVVTLVDASTFARRITGPR